MAKKQVLPAFSIGENMFECRIASIEEINKKWDYEIKNHPNDLRWVTWKEI